VADFCSGDKIFDEMKSSYPDVTTDVVLIDAMPARMVTEPQTFDTIVATSLHADILSDLAAALSGSIGIAPSNNLDPTRKHPSMFEPIHGSAPDIAGKGIANPLGALWSAAEMIRWLGEEPAAEFLMTAIENITSWGVKTRDLNGQNGTSEVASAVMNELERLSRAAPQQ
jgi:isocitrate/isopropylmalate dehydrogenase